MRSFRDRVGESFSTKTFGIALSLLLLISTQAFSSEPKPRARVYVSVTSTKNIKSRIERCLSRELKTLGDVVQSREEIDYVLDVAALKVHQKEKEIGFVLSVTMRRKFDNQLVSFIFKDEFRGLGASWTGDLFQFMGSSIRSGPIENIQSMCREIVGDLHRVILQAIEESKQKGKGKQKKPLSPPAREEIKKSPGK